MRKPTGAYIAMLLPMIFGAVPSAHAARICKDGYVTYTGSAPSASRSVAEANAARAWRRAGTAVYNDGTPQPKVQCVQEKRVGTWRYFVRADHFAAA
jgi:hypothetical protein